MGWLVQFSLRRRERPLVRERQHRPIAKKSKRPSSEHLIRSIPNRQAADRRRDSMTNSKPKLVVLTGSGISAESGIPTFRGVHGIWEGHRVEDVASPGGWDRDPAMVLEFYNQRRKKAAEVQPNRGHEILAELESDFDVTVITQNIDNLHERAGSTNVVHLHGQIFQSRSSHDPSLVYEMDQLELNLGELCEKGSQLRPNIVWFGEAVPMMEVAAEITEDADIFAVVGTSLVIYPAAGLIHSARPSIPKFIVDPSTPDVSLVSNITIIQEVASTGVDEMRKQLLNRHLDS